MKRIKICCLFCLVTLLLNCTGDFDEMNTNPNAPDDVPVETLLPTILIETAKIQDMRPAGFFVQFFAQNSYIVEDRYRFPHNDFLALWNGSYTKILANTKIVQEKSSNVENKNMQAIAEIMSVNAFHTLTDVYGDIPYSEALMLADGCSNPRYDKQEKIYPDLLKRLEIANQLLKENKGEVEGDILFDGDIRMWRVYCSSLILRIAMRMSNVDPQTAQGVIERVVSDPDEYILMSSNGENIRLKWTGVAPYREPWAEEYISGVDGSNHAVSQTMMNYLLTYSDPRLEKYARPTKYDGSYIGAINGPIVGEEQNRDKVSRIGTFYTDDEAGYTKLLTYSEICFILAEAAERGWDVGYTAEDRYLEGIRSSLEYNEIPTDQILQFLSNEDIKYVLGDKENNLYKIALQKWVSLYLQGLQGWAECRRTDVPLLEPVPGTEYPGKHNRIPFRAVWPDTEDMYNNVNFNNAKKEAGIISDSDQLWGKQLWWDTRKNVY